jgi:very-short-patch-repair endonuclease
VLVQIALEAANVMFAPNASFRVGVTTDHRDTVEADFLVWRNLGVLDVDGPWHTDGAAEDHERDRRLRGHGIRVVERYPAERCHSTLDDVVAAFLRLLERNGWPLPSEAS